ncbi:DegV family protein [Syntrophomonas erecta]
MKERIAILADSACDLPEKIIKELNIHILPLKVVYPEGTYSDRVDIEPEDVYKRMPEEIPKTSMPSPHEITSVIEKIREEGFTHLLSISLSSNLSGTYDAIKMMANQMEDLTVQVFDSKTLSIGTGWMVMEAARSIAKGFNLDKVIEHLQAMRPRVKVFYVLETLEYLRRGGRIGNVAAMLGEFMHFKPIISVNEEGRYYVYCKTRGRKKSIESLIQVVEKAAHKPINLSVMHGGARQEAEKVLERLRSLPNVRDIIFSDISPALGVHTGPGLIGISYYEV